MEQPSVRLVDVGSVVNPVTGGVGQAVDGFTVAAGDEVLLINPPNGSAYAGAYVAATGAWARRNDWQNVVEMNPGDWFYVREGTQYQGTTWAFENTTQPSTIDVTPLTIGMRHHRRAIEEGAGIDINGTTPPIISWNAPTDVQSTFLEGLNLEWLSANSLRVKSGAAYIPQTGVADMAADVDLSSLVLTANTWYYIYGYDAGGSVLAIDLPSLQAPNTVPYRGRARSKGPDAEPDLTRRFSGTIRTGAANTIRQFERRGDWVYYQEDTNSAPHRVLSNGTVGNTWTVVNCSGIVPPTSRVVFLYVRVPGGQNVELGNNGTSLILNVGSGEHAGFPFVLNASQQLYYRHPGGVPGTGTNIDVMAYFEPLA